jgi:hypothetical protein
MRTIIFRRLFLHRTLILLANAVLLPVFLCLAPWTAVFGQPTEAPADALLQQWLQMSLASPAPSGATGHPTPIKKPGAISPPQAQAISQVTGVQGTVWRPIGPSPFQLGTMQNNGRVSAIAINPYNPAEIYLGAAGGGVWRSVNAGTNWFPLLDQQSSLGIGAPSALAIDPIDPDIIFVGTSSNDVLNIPAGLLKSEDAGGSWVVVGSGFPAGNSGNAYTLFPNQNINVIRLDPGSPNSGAFEANVLYMATSAGLYYSHDGGLNWTNGAGVAGNVQSLVLDETSPVNARVLLAGVYGQGIFKSTDGGQIWSSVLANPATTITSLAYAPPSASPSPGGVQVVYAALGGNGTNATGTNASSDPIGVFVSTDAGQTWLNQHPVFNSGRSDTGGGTSLSVPGYTLALGVDPSSPGDGVHDVLYYASFNYFISTDSGSEFFNITDGITGGAHSDFVFSWLSPSDPVTLYTGSDGGIWQTTDEGAHWTGTGLAGAPATINAGGLQVGLFSALSIQNSSNADLTIASTLSGGISLNSMAAGVVWTNALQIGAQDVAFDFLNPLLVFASGVPSSVPSAPVSPSNVCTHIYKSLNAGTNWTDVTPWVGIGGTNLDYECPAGSLYSDGVYLAADPENTGVLYASGPQNLWQTLNAGGTWRIIGSLGGHGPVAVCRVNSNFVALAVGPDVYVSRNALAATPTFANLTRNLPGQTITRIAFDPNDPTTLYVTLAGTGAGHVFTTTLAETTWVDISPPLDIPAYGLALDGAPTPTAIYVGTSLGVVRSVDLGQSWTVLDGFHLPNVPVTDIALQPGTGTMRVGTFGRGVFQLEVPGGPVIAISSITGLQFGDVCVGTNELLKLQVFNVGNSTLEINAVYNLMGSSDFRVLGNPSPPLNIAPGSEVDFTIEYQPTSLGSEEALLRIASSDPTAPWVDFFVTGTGVGPAIAAVLPAAGEFGSVPVGCGFADLLLTINNPGFCDLLVTNMSFSSADFLAPEAVSYPLVIFPGDSLTTAVRFQPTAAGPRTGNLTIFNNDPLEPQAVVAMSGAGLPPQQLTAAITASGFFGSVPPCGSSQLLLTLNNSGNCPLTISNLVSTAADFIVPGTVNWPVVLQPGDSLPLTVIFVPQAAGTRLGSLLIASDDPVNPLTTLPVSGIGLPPQQITATITAAGVCN